MAFGGDKQSGGPMAEINVTPLVDVLLVLLIIFMITAPLMAHKIEVDLPVATLENKPDPELRPITLAVRATGEVFWNDEPVSQGLLESRLSTAAQLTPQPQVEIRADKTTKYRIVAEVVKTARLQGIRKVGFVSTPQR